MNKEAGVAALQAIIKSDTESMSSIARKLGVDASQVSRIASGKFRRMTGHALNVCKFALSLQAQQQARKADPELTDKLSLLAAQLVNKNPEAAQALAGILHTLIDDKD
jgi:transcriptional regulator with XRE-family HTH domain